MYFKGRAAICCALLLAGCQNKSAAPPPRYAFAHFENLTGDPALDWVARAASDYLSRTLSKSLDGGVLSLTTVNRTAGNGLPSDRARATVAGATHLIYGYLERVSGTLRFHAVDEDLITHRDARVLNAEAAQPLPALRQLAHVFSASAEPYLTASPEVLRLYITAIDLPPAQGLPLLRSAVDTDPNFGPAWLDLADRNPSLPVIDEALTHKIDAVDKASLRMVKAVLENNRSARVAALRDLAALSPADLALQKTLAETETALGQFSQAAGDWKKLRNELPADKDGWNQLGYALAWAGDFNGAIAAEKDYAARFPADANALDSTGDIFFLYGKFNDAAAEYLKASHKNPEFLAGGDLYKAAWAQFRAGDTKKAAATFELFRAARSKQPAAPFVLLEGDWLYRTGHQKEAETLLRSAADTASPQYASTIWAQLVIWDLLAGDRAAATKDAAIEAKKPPSNIGTVARFAALSSASPAEWQSRADTMIRGAAIDNSRRYALAIALVLDGKPLAARDLWQEIAASSPATDFFVSSLAARLKGEKPKFEIIPDSVNVNQLSGLLQTM